MTDTCGAGGRRSDGECAVGGGLAGRETNNQLVASQLTRRVVDGVNHNYQYDTSGRRTREGWNGGTHAIQWFWGPRGQLAGERFTTPTEVTDIVRATRGDGSLSTLTTSVDSVVTDTTHVLWDNTLPVPQPVWSGQRGQANETLAVYGPDLVEVDCPSGTDCTGPVARDVHGSALETLGTQAVVQADGYGPWGTSDPYAVGAPYGFRGELHWGSLVHLRARDYDPATGLFLSPDPLDGVDGTTTVANPYHYVNNDPVNGTDPTGLRPGEGDCAGALIPFACRYRTELIAGTASLAVGAICAAAAAPAGPIAAGAAGGWCGGAVYRGLTAHSRGDDPWAAALDPKAGLVDAAIGGATAGIGTRALARCLRRTFPRLTYL